MQPRQNRRPTTATARRALLATVAAIAATVVVVPAAAAKGAVAGRVASGPGISAPIVIEDRRVVLDLAQATRFYWGVWRTSETTPDRIDAPRGDLGPRYVLEYDLMTGPNETMPIRQHLYPYAGGGPVAFVPAGQPVDRGSEVSGPASGTASAKSAKSSANPCDACETTRGGWYAVDPNVLATLHDVDLPRPRTRLLRAGTAVPPKRGGWTTLRDDRSGVSIDVPKTWTAGPAVMLPVQLDPVMPIAAGTGVVEAQREGECGPVPQRALEAVGSEDVFVGVYLNQGMASWSATTDRPASFAADLPWGLGGTKCSNTATARLHSLSFEEHGARLTLLVATGARVTAATRAELVAVLDSLRVD
jgi:hypothetical protein